MRELFFIFLFFVSSFSYGQLLNSFEIFGTKDINEKSGVAILVLNVTHPFTVSGNQTNERRKSLILKKNRTPREQLELIDLNAEYASLYSFGDPIAAKEYDTKATPEFVFGVKGSIETNPQVYKQVLLPNLTLTQAHKLINATSTVFLDGIPYTRSRKFRINANEIVTRAVTLDELVAKTREQSRK